MTSPLIRTGLIAGAALSLVAATATFAQAPAPGAPPAPRAGLMHHQQNPADVAKRLRDTLQLRADQEPALQAFITAMQPTGEMREHMQEARGDWQNLTTPQRLDRMQAMMAQHQAQFAKHADAVRRFYAALTPAQQKAFDAMHNDLAGGWHGKGGHMWGHKDRDDDHHGPGMMAPPPTGQ